MGRSIPAEPRWTDDASPAERALWRWAVEQLPDDVLVLPQVAMTVTTTGQDREAEADVVLIDPHHGVTVVEVKGGVVEYDARRAVWRRTGGAGGKQIRDPVQQAKRTRSVVRDAIKAAGIDPNAIALRWAVATPDCRLDAPGEPVLPAAHLWDALAGEQLEARYRSTCGALTTGEQPLGEPQAGYLAGFLRGRTREGRGVLSTAVEDHEVRVRLHTESHRNVLRQIWRNPHVLVRGAAGTGKTVLALEAASSYASMGQRVLLCCWNVVLAAWLRESLRAELAVLKMDPSVVTDDPTGQVVVSHVAGLAQHGVGEVRLPDDPEDRREWFHEVLPDALTPAVTQGEFDVVVLDEAQDLSELWVLAVSSLVKREGRWYAFSDRQQDLFHADAALPDFLELQHELTENFRNSAQIAAFAAQFGDIETDCLTGSGEDVVFVACPGDEVIDRAEEVARKRVREDGIAECDLALLYLFHNPFRDHSEDVAAKVMAGERIVTNGASFKGMERPVVVLGLDLDPTKTDRVEEVRRAIYTAATRARSHLTVVGDPELAGTYGFDGLVSQLRGE